MARAEANFPNFGFSRSAVAVLAFLCIGIPALISISMPATAATPSTQQPEFAAGYGELPLIFEANHGQTDARVRYFARGLGYSLFLTADAAVFHLCDQGSAKDASCEVVRTRLPGASEDVRVRGEDRLPGTSNYFVGDKSGWRSGITQYAKVRYQEVYPGIDLVYYGNQRRLEYDFIVAPGADPGKIRLAYSGADRLHLDKHGNLHIAIPGGELVQRKPEIYQNIDGRRTFVDGSFKLFRHDAATRVAFALGAYDRNLPLIIDPVLSYSTYLGGSNSEAASDIAVDGSGNAYIAGFTTSTDFPAANPLQADSKETDAFVAKLNADGSALIYSTYLGGSDRDPARAIAVDASGNVYVAGYTDSSDFPNASPLQADNPGGVDAFITKLSADGGVLLYSTFLGGSGSDEAEAVAIDSGGNAYVAGVTNSTDFPTVNPLQSSKAGADIAPDVFVAKLNAGGGALLYSTYLGGSDFDGETGVALAVDPGGNAYVAGGTYSTDFPVVNALQPNKTGDVWVQNPFVAKLDAGGGALLYSTYLSGGNGLRGVSNLATAIAADSDGNAYVVGNTTDADFPTTPDALQPSKAGQGDVFITKLNPNGSALVYSTFLGGSGLDAATAVAVDDGGNAYVAGVTISNDFPIVNPVQPQKNSAPTAAFVAKVNAGADALVYSTYLGGSDAGTAAFGLALDDSDNPYIAGSTEATDFPTHNPLQADNAGGSADVFVTKINYGGSGGEDGTSGGGSVGWSLLWCLLGLALFVTRQSPPRMGARTRN